MRALIAGFLMAVATPALADQAPAIIQAGQQPVAFLDVIGGAPKSVVNPYQTQTLTGVPCLWARDLLEATSVPATSTGGTSLIGFTCPYAMHDMRAVFGVYQMPLTVGEVPLPNPITWSGAWEYPIGTITPMTFGGAQSVTARAGIVQSDPYGIDIPSQASPWVRTYVQVSLPPTAASASGGSGGSLSAGTYFVKVTQLSGAQGESGPSPEASATVSSGGTLTINWTPALSWAPPAALITTAAASVPATAFSIYLGTTSGAETYLTTIYNPGATSYTYAGGITQGSATPPTNQVYPIGIWGTAQAHAPGQNEGANYGGATPAGNGSNQTLTPGTSWESAVNVFTWAPIAVTGIPDQGKDVLVVAIDGDSIAAGVADNVAQRGYIARQLIPNNIPYWFLPQPGSTTNALLLTNGAAVNRIQYVAASSVDVDEMGTNDIFAGTTLAALQANQIITWTDRVRRGAKVWQTTILPRVATTDTQATTTNQYPGGSASVTGATNATPIVITYNTAVVAAQGAPVHIAGVGGNTAANGQFFACNVTGNTFQLHSNANCASPVAGSGAFTSGGTGSRFWIEAVRVAENTWLRCLAPIVSGAAVPCGTSNAILAGQPGHPLTGFFEVNAGVEVNFANVLTQNGGYWISDGTPGDCTSDGVHPNGAGALNCQLLPSQAINVSVFSAP